MTNRLPTNDGLDRADAERADFESGWRRSARGNLVKTYDTYTITIFRKYGRYRWCLNGPELDAPEFSEDDFETAEDAIEALAWLFGIGDQTAAAE